MRSAATIMSMTMHSVPQGRTAGVILVGGKSSRMGSNKALLPWRGMRLVDVVANVLTEAGISDIYVSGKVDGYRTIPDLLSEQGPVGGIISSVQQLRRSYVQLLFVPVDMPLLSTDIFDVLLADDGKSEAQHFHEHPLPCLLRLNEHVVQHTQRIQQWMADGEAYSVKRYLEGLKTKTLPVPVEMTQNITNTNTPDEWQEATREPAYQ